MELIELNVFHDNSESDPEEKLNELELRQGEPSECPGELTPYASTVPSSNTSRIPSARPSAMPSREHSEFDFFSIPECSLSLRQVVIDEQGGEPQERLKSVAQKLKELEEEQLICFAEGAFASLERESMTRFYPEFKVRAYTEGLQDEGRKRLSTAFQYYCEIQIKKEEGVDIDPTLREMWGFLKEFCSNPQRQLEILAAGKFYRKSYQPGALVLRIAGYGKAYLEKFQQDCYDFLEDKVEIPFKGETKTISLPLAFGERDQRVRWIDPVPSFFRLMEAGISSKVAARYVANKLSDISFCQIFTDLTKILFVSEDNEDDIDIDLLRVEYYKVKNLWEDRDERVINDFVNGLVTPFLNRVKRLNKRSSEEKQEEVLIRRSSTIDPSQDQLFPLDEDSKSFFRRQWEDMIEEFFDKQPAFDPTEKNQETFRTYCRYGIFEEFFEKGGWRCRDETSSINRTIWVFRQIEKRGVNIEMRRRLQEELESYRNVSQLTRLWLLHSALSLRDQQTLFFRTLLDELEDKEDRLSENSFSDNREGRRLIQKLVQKETDRFFQGESFEKLQEKIKRLPT